MRDFCYEPILLNDVSQILSPVLKDIVWTKANVCDYTDVRYANCC